MSKTPTEEQLAAIGAFLLHRIHPTPSGRIRYVKRVALNKKSSAAIEASRWQKK